MTLTNIRWADAAHTSVSGTDANGAPISIPADIANADYRRLVEGEPQLDDDEPAVPPTAIAPFQRWATLELAQAGLTREVEAQATSRRVAAVGTTDATKLAMYEQKYVMAVTALDGSAAGVVAQSALEPEATARGLTPAELATVIVATGGAWRTYGQALEAASATHKVAIAALADIPVAESYDTAAGWPSS